MRETLNRFINAFGLRRGGDRHESLPGYCFPANAISLDMPEFISKLPLLRRGYEDEDVAQAFIRRVASHTMVTYDGLLSLFDQIRFCERAGIDGSLVELGVWKGGCLAFMALSNLAFGTTIRDIHGFDSFEGLPEHDITRDLDFLLRVGVEHSQTSSGMFRAGRSELEELFVRIGFPRGKLHIHAGWFQETLSTAAPDIGPIAILRLDVDLFESYTIGLECLWDNVVRGGFIVFDDWIYNGCREAVTEFFSRRGVMTYVCYADAGVRYVQKS